MTRLKSGKKQLSPIKLGHSNRYVKVKPVEKKVVKQLIDFHAGKKLRLKVSRTLCIRSYRHAKDAKNPKQLLSVLLIMIVGLAILLRCFAMPLRELISLFRSIVP